MDIVDRRTRSRMMAGIRGRDTKIEVRIRKALWGLGFRYRIPRAKGYKGLPGIPDMVLPKYRAVILINGCFFHGHDCHLFRLPKQNRQFWKEKIEKNRKRDASFSNARKTLGWKTLIVWECSLRGKTAIPFDLLVEKLSRWVVEGAGDMELHGESEN
ncbi:very short patch repair endonuclease [Microbulbifer elongatus]|uniref:very short patch repair endonuclease n=1 Tax=Microbulbifer elongatus TaxID=86173 RepID=UPI00210E7431|nr:DNA mismatch endonuclease Vsr [Microbulbifer elongatus]